MAAFVKATRNQLSVGWSVPKAYGSKANLWSAAQKESIHYLGSVPKPMCPQSNATPKNLIILLCLCMALSSHFLNSMRPGFALQKALLVCSIGPAVGKS